MLIDGNDTRGVNVGVLSRFPIRTVRSHIDDTFTAANGKKARIFSRNCPEYEVALPGGKPLWLLLNHFKSKGFGNPAVNDAKRTRQAKRVRELLKGYDLEKDYVVVAGDFNDTAHRPPLHGLLSPPDLFDVLDSPKLQGPRWIYQDANDQIDYLLVSKSLRNKLKDVGIERRGIFRKDNPHFPEVTGKTTQASDHAGVWAEFAI